MGEDKESLTGAIKRMPGLDVVSATWKDKAAHYSRLVVDYFDRAKGKLGIRLLAVFTVGTGPDSE